MPEPKKESKFTPDQERELAEFEKKWQKLINLPQRRWGL